MSVIGSWQRTGFFRFAESSRKLAKTIRLLIPDKPGYLGRVTTVIGMGGSSIGDIRIVRIGLPCNTREMTIYVDSEEHLARMPATDDAGFG